MECLIEYSENLASRDLSRRLVNPTMWSICTTGGESNSAERLNGAQKEAGGDGSHGGASQEGSNLSHAGAAQRRGHEPSEQAPGQGRDAAARAGMMPVDANADANRRRNHDMT